MGSKGVSSGVLKKHFYHTLPSFISLVSFTLVLIIFLAPTAIFDESLSFLKLSHSSTINTASRSSNVESSLNVEHAIPGRLMNSALRARQVATDSNDKNNQLLLGTLGSCIRIESEVNCSSSSLVPYFLGAYLDFGLTFPDVDKRLGLPLSFPLVPLILLSCIVFLFLSFTLFLLAGLPTVTGKASGLEAKHRLLSKAAVLCSATVLLVGLITTIVFRLQIGDAEQSFNSNISKSGALNFAEIGSAFDLLWTAWGVMSGAIVIGIVGIGMEKK